MNSTKKLMKYINTEIPTYSREFKKNHLVELDFKSLTMIDTHTEKKNCRIINFFLATTFFADFIYIL